MPSRVPMTFPSGKWSSITVGCHRQEVARAQELGHELRRRLVVDALRIAQIFVAPRVHDGEAVTESHGLVLVVGDVEECDAHFALDAL